MKLIVGLGNPGKEYQETRHSIGFKIVDYLAKKHNGDFVFDKKVDSEVVQIKIDSEKVLLAKPQMFVNNSGKAVKKIIKNWGLKMTLRGVQQGSGNLIIVHDDIDIPFGKVKVSFGRSSAGHKGVESIIKALKTDKFYRVRIGTYNSQIVKIKRMKDKRRKLNEIGRFVLGSFSGSEKKLISKIIKEAEAKILNIL